MIWTNPNPTSKPGVRLFTVEEYHQMTEIGVLHPDERVELIEGQIISMAAKGAVHVVTVSLAARLLQQVLGEAVLIRTQDPIWLHSGAEPEPDIAVVQGSLLDYSDHHPTPSETYLIIEVADSTLKFDCETKARSYAQAGIEDYWVLDVNNRQLFVFRQPVAAQYQDLTIYSEVDSLAPLKFPEQIVSIAQMLPSQSKEK